MKPSALWVKDLLALSALAVVCLVAGWGLNSFRKFPLSMIYQSPEARLKVQVERIKPDGHSLPDLGPIPDGVRDWSMSEVDRLIREKKGILLDARPEIFHRMGHIPGALSLPRSDFEKAYLRLKDLLEADRSQAMVIYCNGANCEDSRMVQQALSALGFTQAGIYRGGWEEWKSSGQPIQP